ncbi:Histidine kinase [Rhodovastum atsumiense]|uniref:histidine kinase n=1 Tax=Rhodovastum atsumiense TaxID=504468 RepID=A0A5M6ILX0_9PROT|nr:ATP-binding protein [Rhodovastum atsumiense]KAA5609276.1 response regulator [Rhodovastum atsumiense]CAH2604574.1 Histidine kinase [Rhodovastum atsumiense]
MNERTVALIEETRRRIKAETLFLQAQKMQAIGQLTGGIAHDFNNLLQVILGSLDIAGRRLHRGEALDSAPGGADGVLRPMDNARRAAGSAAQLTQRLLAFGRRQALEPTELRPNAFVEGFLDLIRHTLGGAVAVETALADDLWPIFADANQLEAVLLNLVVNARDAMPSGGRLTIGTANVTFDEANVFPLGDVQPGDYVLLSITDTGAGIAEDVLEHVFEPFFTTKPPGRGTGLGLAMVHGFVKQSGGHAHIYSEVANGTIVKIYLPRFVPGAGNDALPASPAIDRASLPKSRGGETILLVEDSEDVRHYVEEALAELGYDVTAVADADEALIQLGADRIPGITLLFTDIVMPGSMDGFALAKQAAERWPKLPVLFTTGYSNAAMHGHASDAQARTLTKPYSFAALARKVRETLDAVPR